MAALRRPGAALPPTVLLLLALSVSAAAGAAPEQVCGGGCCAGAVRNGSAVASVCGARAGAVLRGRCCLERDRERDREVVLGLDLGNCSLHQLCSGFPAASAALIIDLTGNPLQALPADTFRGFTKLQTLALPRELPCPGGSEGWDNVTVEGSSRICQGQRNPCNASAGPGWQCPEDARCAPAGPGLPQCLCADPHHGYKCMRQREREACHEPPPPEEPPREPALQPQLRIFGGLGKLPFNVPRSVCCDPLNAQMDGVAFQLPALKQRAPRDEEAGVTGPGPP